MDVRCERCSTEYEFDDALVSGRGTTVKCTNCGYKFKIRRSDGDYSEDFWNVTAGDGRTLVFTSLRELQRAIQSYLVDRHDRLSRGGLPPKAIGEIPELAPFFEQRESKRASLRTQDGLGPPSAHEPAYEHAHEPEPSSRSRQATKPEFPAPPPEGTPGSNESGGKTTLIGTGPRTMQPAFEATGPSEARRTATAPPPPPVLHARAPSAPPPTERQQTAPVHVEPAPQRRVSVPPPVPRRDSLNTAPIQRPPVPRDPSHAPRGASHPPPVPQRGSDPGPSMRPSEPAVRAASVRPSEPRVPSAPPPLPPPARDTARRSAPPVRAPERSLLAEIDDDHAAARSDSMSDGLPPRRRSAGLFVAVALVGGMAIFGAAWAKKNYMATAEGKTPAPAVTVDPRVATFLSAGEKALTDGNLDLAKESFDKASALAEKDPHVLLGLARLAAIRADTSWLRARLLPTDAADEQRVTRDALSEFAGGARAAADAALAVAPEDIAAVRAKIDALRIAGDRDAARALVGKIGSSASQVESAYVLAALDLASDDQAPSLAVIDRLKLAANVETGPGRARAALVYALARSGDAAGAKAEVDRLSAMTKPHVLLPLLRSYAEHAKGTAAVDAGAAAPPTAAIAASAERDAKGHKSEKGEKAVTGGAIPSDSRELLSQGERARAKGDYERAKTLFNAAVEKNPNDSEALAGLGAIAYAQRDLNGARAAYKRVVAINPNYMPAVVGLADVEWDAGDRATATRMYKDIVDRYPEGAYPARVKQRSDGGG